MTTTSRGDLPPCPPTGGSGPGDESIRRALLFVHAHPDDEAIGTGATMAHYARAGVHVTLVTCTLGELGEIHVPELAGLAADRADQLGGYRIAELRQACGALGVTDQRYLGGAGRYRDSGMAGWPTNDHPRAFWRADPIEAATALLEVIRDVRPQVVVTYDPQGLYGHPDHIRAHQVTTQAVDMARAEGLGPAKVYWTCLPRSVVETRMEWLRGTSGNPFAEAQSVDDLPFVTPAEAVTTRIDASAHRGAKTEALRAHATQIPADSWLLALAGGDDGGVEYYRLADGPRGPGHGLYHWEDDLFAGCDAC